MSKEKEQDPYKYFQQKLKGKDAAFDSDSDDDEEISVTDMNNLVVANDQFEDDNEYSMNDEEDFSLSVSMKKPDSIVQDKKPTSTMLSKMSQEQKKEAARKKAEEEFKRIQADDSADSDSEIEIPTKQVKNKQLDSTKGAKKQPDPYDYFVNKDKIQVGEAITESDDFSEVSKDSMQQPASQQQPIPAKTLPAKNQVKESIQNSVKQQPLQQNANSRIPINEDIESDKDEFIESDFEEDIANASVPSEVPIASAQASPNQLKQDFVVHNNQQSIAGNSTVNKGSVVPGAVGQAHSFFQTKQQSPKNVRSPPQTPGSIDRQMKQIDRELRQLKPKHSPPQKEETQKQKPRPKTSVAPRAPSSQKPKEDLTKISAPKRDNLIVQKEKSKSRPEQAQKEKIIKRREPGLKEETRPESASKEKSKPRPESAEIKKKEGKKRPQTSHVVISEKTQKERKERPPSHKVQKLDKEPEVVLTNLQIISSKKITNDITKDAEKSAKFNQAKKAKEIAKELAEVKKEATMPKQLPQKENKQRAINKNNKDIKVVHDEVNDEFNEVAQEEGDQSMPMPITKSKLGKADQIKQDTQVKQKPKTNTKKLEPVQLKQSYATFKMKYMGVSESEKGSVAGGDFDDQELDSGDQSMPLFKKSSKQKRMPRGEFDEVEIEAGDQLMPENEIASKPAAKKASDLEKIQLAAAPPLGQAKMPFGSNPDRLKQENWSEMQKRGAEDFVRFQQLQKELQSKQSQGNPALNTFMAGMQQQIKVQKEQLKIQQLNPLATKEINIQKQGREPAFEQIIDKEDMTKQVSDFTLQLKQIFFENKTIQKKTVEFDQKRRNAQMQMERVMKENNLVRVNGAFQSKTQSTNQRMQINNADIPDYDKVKQPDNPMEAIVAKLDLMGYSAEQAFMAFDWDGDEVLTIQEIKDGLRANGIKLFDHEWQLLVNAIDKNCDGVLTVDEWINVLEPKIDAQRNFIDIMKEIDISDPLELEERILDLQFKKRRLDNEVRLMRRQKQTSNFFKNQKVKEEHKVVAEKIKELEEKVKQKKFTQQEQQDNFASRLMKGPQTRADLESEMEMLNSTMSEMQIKYFESQAKHQTELFTLDQRFRTVNEFAEMVRQDRDIKKIQLKGMQKQLEIDRAREVELDKEIESILGRAVTQADLDDLYLQDMKLLNQIEAGLNNKIGTYKQIIAAIKLQKVWRGKLARNQVKKKIIEVVNKPVQVKKDEIVQSKVVLFSDQEQKRRLKAALLIQRAWRRYQARRNEIIRLRKRNQDRREKDEQQKKEKADLIRKIMLIKKVQRFWRARQEARKSGSTISNPFKSTLKFKNSLGTNEQSVTYEQSAICITCQRQEASRLCRDCNTNQCNRCYVELHSRGQRKRHTFAKIIYKGRIYEDVIPERSQTFNSSVPAVSIKGTGQSISFGSPYKNIKKTVQFDQQDQIDESNELERE